MKVYLAGSIFYDSDVLINTIWAQRIRDVFPGIDLYSPIENTDINGAEGKRKSATATMIAQADNARLDNTDVLFARLDGDLLPVGTSSEIGVMREKVRTGAHKYTIGILTDNRGSHKTWSEAKFEALKTIGEQQFSYANLYVIGNAKESGIVVDNINDAIAFLKSKAAEFGQEYIDNVPWSETLSKAFETFKSLDMFKDVDDNVTLKSVASKPYDSEDDETDVEYSKEH